MTGRGPARTPERLRKLGAIDRRLIFLLVFLGALIPILHPLGLGVQISPPVRAVFQSIDRLAPGDAIVLSFDYGPSDGPELDPMANAILRHCVKKGVRVIGISLYSLGGVDMARARFRQLVSDMHARPGIDFVNLGYKDGAQAAMRAMGLEFPSVFPRDVNNTPYEEIPAARGIRNFADCKLAVTLCTSIIGQHWVNLVNAQFRIPLALGATAVSAPKYYAYVEAGQAIGVIGGMKGASEYEELLAKADPDLGGLTRTATVGMDVQSIVHLIVIALIVLGNVAFLASRRGRMRGDGPTQSAPPTSGGKP
ncbi:MAG: hypothetical protein KBD56_00525 [Candidatus Eisenbacteria bacterium]|nr:hypothetical protein [Candidatus Eisenbacteria bacterium]